MKKLRLSIRAGLLSALAGITAMVIISATTGFLVLKSVIGQQSVISEEALPASLAAAKLFDGARTLAEFSSQFERSTSQSDISNLADSFLVSLDNTELLIAELNNFATNQVIVDRADALIGELGEVVTDFISVSRVRISASERLQKNDAVVSEHTAALGRLSESLISNARATVSNRLSRLYDTVEDPDLIEATYDAIDQVLDVDQPYVSQMTDLRTGALLLRQHALSLKNAAGQAALIEAQDKTDSTVAALQRSINNIDDPVRKGDAEAHFAQIDPLFERENPQSFFAARSQLFEMAAVISKDRNALESIQTGLNAAVSEIVSDSERQIKTAIKNAHDGAITGRQTLIVIAIASSILSIGICYLYVGRNILFRLKKLRATTTQLADGNLDVDIPSTSHDELGQMAAALTIFQEKLAEQHRFKDQERQRQEEQNNVVEQLTEGMQHLANGQLMVRLEQAFAEDYEDLRLSFNTSIAALEETIGDVISSAGSINSGASEISQAANELAKRTERQAATLEETAAALEEMTLSVNSAAQGARNVESAMGDAREEAQKSGLVVQEAVSAMTEIVKSSDQIAQIIGVIDDIAFQTNLLALNAGVEAARAGDAGRGFAVVASEVRGLAQKSAEAATQIKDLIDDSSKHVERGVDLVGKAGTALTSIAQQVNNISNQISDIATGSVEQASGITEINGSVAQLDTVTQQNATMVEEATAAGQLLHNDAKTLTQLMSRFAIQNNRDAVQQHFSEEHTETASSKNDETIALSTFAA